jgi:DNA-directed RNA polymerase specialized sigma subunit
MTGGEKVKEKSKAQVFLESYELNTVKMECKLTERQFWNDLSMSITGQMDGERVQSSGVRDKMAQARDACMEMEEHILSQVHKLADKQKEVTGVLDQLDNPTHLKILHMRYIQLIELEDIADAIGISYDNLTTTHGRALKKVEALMTKS